MSVLARCPGGGTGGPARGGDADARHPLTKPEGMGGVSVCWCWAITLLQHWPGLRIARIVFRQRGATPPYTPQTENGRHGQLVRDGAVSVCGLHGTAGPHVGMGWDGLCRVAPSSRDEEGKGLKLVWCCPGQSRIGSSNAGSRGVGERWRMERQPARPKRPALLGGGQCASGGVTRGG